ncbi:hypothetical protein KBC03_03595 [Patescibacteria group bacterium]|nr:hypothetical protein [Patescibacteria group bacterium]
MQGLVKQNQPFSNAYTAKDKAEADKILEIIGGNSMDSYFKTKLVQKFHNQGETKFTFYLNTIPAAASEKLLNSVQPDYKEKYNKVTDYFQNQGFIEKDQFVTFIDLCEG